MNDCQEQESGLRESLQAFLSELERFYAGFSASDDYSEAFDEPTLDVLTKEHPLDLAATDLRQFYRSNKLPVEVRQTYRKLIRELQTQHDWELLEQLVESLLDWVNSELDRLGPEPAASPSMPQTESAIVFDVFLSHNSKDKPEVKRLGETLKKRSLTVWLDEWELRPGLSWQDALEDIIANCKSAAVCVGDNGIGPWEDPEMKALLRRFVEEKKTGNLVPIIPVLLPGAPDDVTLPLFLGEFTWVDLRGGLKKESLDRLEWGITGVKPNP